MGGEGVNVKRPPSLLWMIKWGINKLIFNNKNLDHLSPYFLFFSCIVVGGFGFGGVEHKGG